MTQNQCVTVMLTAVFPVKNVTAHSEEIPDTNSNQNTNSPQNWSQFSVMMVRPAAAAVVILHVAIQPSTGVGKSSVQTVALTQLVIQSDISLTNLKSTNMEHHQETLACQEWNLHKQLGKEIQICHNLISHPLLHISGHHIKLKVALDQSTLMPFLWASLASHLLLSYHLDHPASTLARFVRSITSNTMAVVCQMMRGTLLPSAVSFTGRTLEGQVIKAMTHTHPHKQVHLIPTIMGTTIKDFSTVQAELEAWAKIILQGCCHMAVGEVGALAAPAVQEALPAEGVTSTTMVDPDWALPSPALTF